MKKLKSCNVQRKQIVKIFVFFSGRAKYVKKIVLKYKNLLAGYVNSRLSDTLIAELELRML
ncbi:MAG: hypothetical protein CL599_02630 [Alteromonas sp.]|nr:hypothetical protein [Alteromonas sp.]OUX91185.1 MAG: hypothetical protein CBB95_02685 [Alteromonas sp. TMED35]|tara:strand:- start:8464 stop:8646 length:183 start_codon:yes stop_codon:yes gene_type:complete